MAPENFVEDLSEVNHFKDTFNPYSSCCEIHDHPDASCRRSEALLAILKAAEKTEIDSLWIGRDLGYKGGRRTGLAFTDDVHLVDHANRWGIEVERPTKGEEVAEHSATTIWTILNQVDAKVFLWNVFPLHPHEPGDPFTNRQHNTLEREKGEKILGALIELLEPRRLVPIGNDAAAAAKRLCGNREIVKIRHPSFGGRKLFEKQAGELYNL